MAQQICACVTGRRFAPRRTSDLSVHDDASGQYVMELQHVAQEGGSALRIMYQRTIASKRQVAVGH